jgi:hypothetical protein
MNIKRILISVAVCILVEKTNLIRKTDSTEAFFANLFGLETEQERVTRELDEASDKAIKSAKKFALDRKFKKVTKDF